MKRRIHSRLVVVVLAVVVALGQADQAKADVITDPTGFLPSYTGPQVGALDVIQAGGTFDGTTFHLFATLAGPFSSAPAGSSYIWGINTGTGTAAPFASIGSPNVRFNTAPTLRADGTANNPAFTPIINGNVIELLVPLSALPPSTGFAPQDYTWNLWPRGGANGVAIGGNGGIPDFVPDNAMARFTFIPEPATVAVFSGLALAGAFGYRRRKVKAAA
jgi:hypothetical protein